jgi:cytochrome c biogenesis protein CcdA
LFIMKKEVLISFIFIIFVISFVSAQTEVSYFHGNGCSHCALVAESGIIEKVSELENISVEKYEIYNNPVSRQKFLDVADLLNLKVSERGIPFVLINCSGNLVYLVGDKPIIEDLEKTIENCESNSSVGNINSENPNANEITLGGIVLGAIVDSINPCAIGVLVFLMIALLGLGSSKRALRAGLLYTFVVFVVYFLAGLGIFSAIQSLSKIGLAIHFFIGFLVLVIGLVEWNDVYREFRGKKAYLAISEKIKPFIEKMSRKGTILAIVILGTVVSLFELPCTGGIYVAILGLMAQQKTFSYFYLALYNFIFVLPLIVLTFLIYKGANPKVLERWNQKEKKWMRIGGGAVLILLGLYMIFSLV